VEVESIRQNSVGHSSLIEGSILPERFGALPREGRTFRPERFGALPREGRTLRPERFGALPRGGRTLGAGAPVDDGGKQTQAAHKGSNAIKA
jgi:hypothetical protein